MPGRIRRIYEHSQLYDVFNLKDTDARNRVNVITSGVMGAIVANMSTGVFLTGFLLQAGMNVSDIGFLSAIPLMMSVCSLFTPALLRGFKSRKKILCGTRLLSHALNLGGVALVMLLPLDKAARFALLTGLFVLANASTQLFASGFSAWHFNFLPDKVRVSYITVQQLVNAALSAITLLAAGVLSDWARASGNADTFFFVLRVAAFLFAALEVWLLSRATEYPYKPESGSRSPFAIFPVVARHKKFLKTMGAVFLWNFAAFLTAAVLDVHLLQDVGMPYTLISGANASFFLFLLVLSGFWNGHIRRASWLKTFGVGVALHAPFSMLMGFVAPGNYFWLYPVVRIAQLALYVGIVITLTNMPYLNLPGTDHTACFSFHLLVTNLAAFTGQMTGSLLVTLGPGLRFTLFGTEFGITAVVCLLQGLVMAATGLYAWRRAGELTPSPQAEAEAGPEFEPVPAEEPPPA